MMRKEFAGEYQIGIWNVRRDPDRGGRWLAVAIGPGTLGDGNPHYYPTLRAAHLALTREPPHGRPHVMTNGKKKQVARLIKCECATCGYVVRTAQSWLDDKGAPHCPDHGEMQTA